MSPLCLFVVSGVLTFGNLLLLVEERRERKPLNLKPRSEGAPVGNSAPKKGSNPFGDAKPRDESKFQERQRESERKEERKTPDRGNAGPKRGGFRNKHEGAEGRDFSQARSNMGKKPAPKAEEKKPKQSKPQTVVSTHPSFLLHPCEY